MQRFSELLLIALVCVAAGARSRRDRGDHPVGQVVELLQELKEQAKTEGQNEELTYEKFKYWCVNSGKTLSKAIEEGKATVEQLESKIEAKKLEEESLAKSIKKLEKELEEFEAAGRKAEDARSEAAVLYGEADKDLELTIKAVADAITAIKDSKDSSLLTQLPAALVRATKLPLVLEQLAADPRMQALLDATDEPREGHNRPPPADADDLLAKGDRKSHEKKYNFKSGNVIELLKELQAMFEDERVQKTKEETNSMNEFELAKAAREDAIKAATTSKEQKEANKADAEAERAEAEASLESTKADLEADEESLKNTKTTCETRSSEWAERSEIRAKEMEAMDVAIKILAKVSGVRTEPPSNPVPPPAPEEAAESFLQVITDPKARAVNLLRAEAKRSHSKAFSRFTEQLAARAAGSPFKDINEMIQKMVFRLMAEQKNEDDHKNWCDVETSKSESSKTSKEEKIESLKLKIEVAKATVQELVEEITAADDMVAQLTQFRAELTEVREAGKMENAAAIKDAEEAQRALNKAAGVIEAHYKESGEVPKESWEFVQNQRQPVTLPEEPSTWEAGYTGVADPSAQPAGIITLLRKVESDFSQMEADTRAAEETDAKEYQNEMAKSDIELTRRRQESENKEAQEGRLREKIGALEKTKKMTNAELASVKQYIEELQPACVDGDSTYEDRKGARTKEIDSLREAQQILRDAFKEEPSSFLAPIART